MHRTYGTVNQEEPEKTVMMGEKPERCRWARPGFRSQLHPTARAATGEPFDPLLLTWQIFIHRVPTAYINVETIFHAHTQQIFINFDVQVVTAFPFAPPCREHCSLKR